MSVVGVVRFLGTNCDADVFEAVKSAGHTPRWLWYQDTFNAADYSAVILPGGFSYGDYLRCGALAARAPVMKSVSETARKGVPVLGICNGFQILCEAGLLPGVLVRNSGLKFVDKWVNLHLRNESPHWRVQGSEARGAVAPRVKLPVAHGEGRYCLEEDQVKRLFDNEQVWWCYEKNPNGSIEDIAGVMNEKKNVAALMPHPERAMAAWMGGRDGAKFFEGIA